MKSYTYMEIFPDNRPNWLSKLEINAWIEEKRQQFTINRDGALTNELFEYWEFKLEILRMFEEDIQSDCVDSTKGEK